MNLSQQLSALLKRIFRRNKLPHGTYRLKKYHWRSFLTIIGPLVVVAFYAFVCFAFLAKAPQNDIVMHQYIDARWIYYIWFVVAVFTLDWSRAGLANIEATALMYPRLAPSSAAQLMWHTDMKWANLLWWLRAIRSGALKALQCRRGSSQKLASCPGVLWVFLSLTTLLLFVALPLSGLSMELREGQTPTTNKVQILGPGPNTFHSRFQLDLPEQIRRNWQSGRKTTPSSAALFYAPQGFSNASALYFDNLAMNYADHIEFFAPPAVEQLVVGQAWGLYGNISCNPVFKNQLQMLHIDDFNYAIETCSLQTAQLGLPTFDSNQCKLVWRNSTNSIVGGKTFVTELDLPLWLNETRAIGDLSVSEFSYIAAADGWVTNSGPLSRLYNPYTLDSNHDNMTFDHIKNKRPGKDPTNAMFEMFLWQSNAFPDDLQTQLTQEGYPDPVETINSHFANDGPESSARQFFGIGVHCDITTAVGYADLDPAHRTFSSFKRSKAKSVLSFDQDDYNTYFTTILYDISPPQILAMISLSSNEHGNLVSSPLAPVNDNLGIASKQTWTALHSAIDSFPLPPNNRPNTTVGTLGLYHVLRPKDLQVAIYKLLGESVIALMDQGGVQPWTGDLYALGSINYLNGGKVPWQLILALLIAWASIMSGGALWIISFAWPRWAHSLDGFEMFKLGAQYANEVNDFVEVDFQKCSDTLERIPGMVGMFPGLNKANNAAQIQLGFIGLSENVASKDVLYTLDRRQAAGTRIP